MAKKLKMFKIEQTTEHWVYATSESEAMMNCTTENEVDVIDIRVLEEVDIDDE